MNIQNLSHQFYIVALPIGNLADITYRAVQILSSVDIIYCEDTRVTTKLLRLLDIKFNRLAVYNDHSSENQREQILEHLQNGLKIALVSDAGTPLIADPGYKLIRFLYEHNVTVTSIPGPSSVIAALTLSGLATDSFYFAGFLPSKQGELRSKISELSAIKTTIVVFDTAIRILNSLKIIDELFPELKLVVVKEISKIFEETIAGKANEIISFFNNNHDKLRGEMVILMDTRTIKNEIDHISLEKLVKEMVTNCYSQREIIEFLKVNYNISRNDAYKVVLGVKG